MKPTPPSKRIVDDNYTLKKTRKYLDVSLSKRKEKSMDILVISGSKVNNEKASRIGILTVLLLQLNDDSCS